MPVLLVVVAWVVTALPEALLGQHKQVVQRDPRLLLRVVRTAIGLLLPVRLPLVAQEDACPGKRVTEMERQLLEPPWALHEVQ